MRARLIGSSVIVAALAASVCAVAAQAQGARRGGGESSRRVVNEAGVSFVYSAGDFRRAVLREQKRLTAQEAGTDIPVEVFPASRCFVFESARAAAEIGPNLWDADNFVCFFPLGDPSVADFRAAYPQLSESAARLRRLLRSRPARLGRRNRWGFWDGLPEMPLRNASVSLLARAGYLDFRAASGILFLAQHSQEMPATPAANDRLAAHFQGITRDGRFYVAAQFDVDHPSLPADDGAVNYGRLDKRLSYLRRDEARLNRAAEDSFGPSLKSLKALLSSIEVK